MESVLFWSVAGPVSGVLVALLIGVITYRRQFPKRQVEWWCESTRLVADAGQTIEGLQIRVAGIEVPDPYLNTLTVFSNSRADISSSSFDAGEPIKITMTRGGVLQLVSPLSDGIKIAGGRGEGFELAEFDIEPQLIRKGVMGQLMFVSSGPPVVELTSPLPDIPLRHLTESEAAGRTPDGRKRKFASWSRLAVLSALVWLLGAGWIILVGLWWAANQEIP